MVANSILTEQEIEIINNQVESEFARTDILNSHLLEFHRDTPLSIRIPFEEFRRVRSRPFSYDLVRGKASLRKGDHPINQIEVDCFVASGRWDQVQVPTTNEIDIIEHLHQLLPQGPKRQIGLFTAQNGIQNDFASQDGLKGDFKKMCKLITSKLESEKPLFIGLYNPTSGKGLGIVDDLQRLMNEWTLNTLSILMLRQLFATFANLLPKINSQLLWAHIAHSEGGLLAQKCLTDSHLGLSFQDKNHMKRHLITLVYGGVAPIPDGVSYEQINTYSDKDIALHLNKKYLDKFPNWNKAIQDENLRKIAQQIDDTTGLREESIEEKFAKFSRGEYSLYQAMHSQGVKRGNAEKYFNELQTGRDSAYITKYPHISKKNGHTLTIVKSLVKNPSLIAGDHGFTEETYQDALQKNIIRFRRRDLL